MKDVSHSTFNNFTSILDFFVREAVCEKNERPIDAAHENASSAFELKLLKKGCRVVHFKQYSMPYMFSAFRNLELPVSLLSCL